MSILALMMVQVSPVVETVQDPTIVINGKSLAGTREAVERCLSRTCPPDQDIRAALQYANQQFLAGYYVEARRTIAAARKRNGRFANRFPELVSDLARADARLSNLDGRPARAMSASLDALDAVKAGLDDSDPTILMQRLELGDQFARIGRLEGAAAVYQQVAKQGRALGNVGVEGHALFRDAVLYAAVASVAPEYRSRARKAIARIMTREEPAFTPFRDAVVLLDARLKAIDAKASRRLALLDTLPKVPLSEPVLVYEPFTDLQQAGLTSSTTASDKAEWADVGFWVKSDGTVDDVEIRAMSSVKPGGWLPLKLKAVANRRYAPFDSGNGSPGLYRVERYSVIYNRSNPITSRLVQRQPTGMIDTTSMSTSYREREVPVK
jgi:hypothetical protein